MKNKDIEEIAALEDGWYGRERFNGPIIGKKFRSEDMKFADDLLTLLIDKTNLQWYVYPHPDDLISIESDSPDFCIDLIFDLKKIIIRNYESKKKDKIILPQECTSELWDFISEFLK